MTFRGLADRNTPPTPATARYDGDWYRAGSLDDQFQIYRETEIAAGRIASRTFADRAAEEKEEAAA